MNSTARLSLSANLGLLCSVLLFSVPAQQASDEDLSTMAEALAEKAQLTDSSRQPVKPQVTAIADKRYRIGESLEINSETRTINIPVKLQLDGRTRADETPAATPEEGEVPIEFYLVEATNGPRHETLLTTAVKPAELQLALLLLSYKADQRVLAKQRTNSKGDPISPARNELMDALLPEIAQAGQPESLLKLTLNWTDEEKGEQSLPLASALKKKNDLREAEEINFAFTGSYQEQNYFAAARQGLLISSFLVHEAILNPADTDALADDLLVPNAQVLPAAGQKMLLTLSPAVELEEAD